MKLKPLISAAAAAGLLTLASAPAHALLVLDAWQLNLGGGNVTTNIGHLVTAGLGATVNQEVGGGGVFVGARFSEFGAMYSISAERNNLVGTGDTGGFVPLNIPGTMLVNELDIRFTGLSGTVTTIGPSAAFGYAFTPGVGSIDLILADQATHSQIGAILATFSLVNPSNGGFNNAIGITATGSSTVLSMVLSDTPNLFRDSTGTSLDPYIPGGLFFNIITQNSISSTTGPAACSFDAGAMCITAQIQSNGPVDLLRVPEPGTLLLLGIGLAGFGFGARRKQVAA